MHSHLYIANAETDIQWFSWKNIHALKLHPNVKVHAFGLIDALGLFSIIRFNNTLQNLWNSYSITTKVRVNASSYFPTCRHAQAMDKFVGILVYICLYILCLTYKKERCIEIMVSGIVNESCFLMKISRASLVTKISRASLFGVDLTSSIWYRFHSFSSLLSLLILIKIF